MRFCFRLQRLLDVRVVERDRWLRELAAIERLVDEIEQRIQAVTQSIERNDTAFTRDLGSAPRLAPQARGYLEYQARLREQERRLQIRLGELETVREQCERARVEAEFKVKRLERARELAFEQFRSEAIKREDAELDELGVLRYRAPLL